MSHQPLWTDITSAIAALLSILVAIFSTYFVVLSLRQTEKALKQQRVSSDAQTTLVIWERLDLHWKRFLDSKSNKDKIFEFGQLISYYEISCSLFRHKSLSTSASLTLGEHLRDILTSMKENEDFSQYFDKIKNNDDNYENIDWFLKNHANSLKSFKAASR